MNKPLYRAKVQGIDATFVCIPGDLRGIFYPDVDAPFPTPEAFEAYHSCGFGLGDGALPIMDMEHVTVGERLYASIEEYWDAREKADPEGAIEGQSVQEFRSHIRQTFSKKVRHQDREWFAPRYSTRRRTLLWDPVSGEEKTVREAALVDLDDNARTQILHQGEVCLYLHGHVTSRDGTRSKLDRSLIQKCADQPVGPRVTYRGRECHYKWKCAAYALVYDPKIKADRKVSMKALTWIDPQPNVL